MKNIDNDMDELFNKAGQDYPLNTEKRNWEAVNKVLHSGEEATPAAKKRWYRFLLPFVLLISVPTVIYLTGVGDRESEVGNRESEVGSRESEVGNRKSEVGSKTQSADLSPEALAKPKALTKAESGNRDSEIGSRESGIGIRESVVGKLKSEVGSRTPSADMSPEALAKAEALTKAESRNREPEIGSREPGIRSREPGIGSLEPEVLKNFFSVPQLSNSYNVNGSPSENIHQPFKNTTFQQSATTKSRKSLLKKTTGFYYGLVAAVDVSTVKMQEVKQPGSSVGLMAGYQFAPHWSVELSGKWSTKKYYSDGKYFDKTGANIPAYVHVYDLTGGCNMFEFPVNVRYLFKPGENSFFATAGVTSYFMNKESYDYTADAGGAVYEGYRNYKNSGNHLFSNLQLTGGYQFKLFSKTNLRIEPYVLLPLKKIGVGKMPITSMGVQFGLMRITR